MRGFRLYGVMVLGVTMIVAAFTHFQAGEMMAMPVPLFLLMLVGRSRSFGSEEIGPKILEECV